MYDPIGKTFNFLTCLSEAPRKRKPSGGVVRRIRCRCCCGKVKEFDLLPVRDGRVKSCGCMRSFLCRTNNGNKTHGMSFSKEWYSWKDMLRRCNNPRKKGYDRYGGRGISVCESWQGEGGFIRFLEDMGRCPRDGMSIDRIDNDGDYTPENCRWASNIVQANNTRKNVILKFGRRSMTIAQWSRELGIPYGRLQSRIKRGWSPERALTTP